MIALRSDERLRFRGCLRQADPMPPLRRL